MKFVLFYHSLISDWNHGNAHFLRGVVKELAGRGHEVTVFEPIDGWSRRNLVNDAGQGALDAIESELSLGPYYRLYDPANFDPAPWVEEADVTIVHEWNPPSLVARIGACKRLNVAGRMLFHDTHHRAVSAPEEMSQYDLSSFDGALVFGSSLKREYVRHGWTDVAWVWHEAADTSLFYPRPEPDEMAGDFVWIGNWGDGEREAELETYLFNPIGELGLRGDIFGVRYPEQAKRAVQAHGLQYRGWLPNHRAPEIFASHRFTAHVPRRYYAEMLPGIPTIRVFEALACGIPLVCAPWTDSEGLFEPGADYLLVESGSEMRDAMEALVEEDALADRLRAHGLATILSRHTCAHRVDELLAICEEEERERMTVSLTGDDATRGAIV